MINAERISSKTLKILLQPRGITAFTFVDKISQVVLDEISQLEKS